MSWPSSRDVVPPPPAAQRNTEAVLVLVWVVRIRGEKVRTTRTTPGTGILIQAARIRKFKEKQAFQSITAGQVGAHLSYLYAVTCRIIIAFVTRCMCRALVLPVQSWALLRFEIEQKPDGLHSNSKFDVIGKRLIMTNARGENCGGQHPKLTLNGYPSEGHFPLLQLINTYYSVYLYL